MRPPNKDEEEGEVIAQKMSGDSLSILGQTFTFDSVADAESTQASSNEVQLFVLFMNKWLLMWYAQTFHFIVQLDIFQLVGSPLVENCLSGFNSSVFAYGQVSSYSSFIRFSFHTISGDNTDIRFLCVLNLIWLDWEWEDIYHVGSSQCLVGWKPFKQQTRPNTSCIWATFCTHKWGDFQFYLCQTSGSLYEYWAHITCIITFHHRSKLSMLTNSWSINVAVHFLRLSNFVIGTSSCPWLVELWTGSHHLMSDHLYLQIYNEQITDLLDPSQKNLQVEGFYCICIVL